MLYDASLQVFFYIRVIKLLRIEYIYHDTEKVFRIDALA